MRDLARKTHEQSYVGLLLQLTISAAADPMTADEIRVAMAAAPLTGFSQSAAASCSALIADCNRLTPMRKCLSNFSIPMNRRPVLAHATPVEKAPAVESRTVAPGAV